MPIESYRINELPISFINGSFQHHLIVDNPVFETSIKNAGLKSISCIEINRVSSCEAKKWRYNNLDSGILFQFERSGKPLQKWPKDARFTYYDDSLIRTCSYSKNKTLGCGTGGYSYESHYYNEEFFYEKGKPVKILINGSISGSFGSKNVLKTVLMSEKKKRKVKLANQLILVDGDTTTNRTVATVYYAKNKPLGIYNINLIDVDFIGSERKITRREIRRNAKKLFKQILISDETNWNDSAFEAYDEALYDKWEKISYRIYDLLELKRELINYSVLEKYSTLTDRYTGYEYDKKGRLIKRGVFFRTHAERIDELKYNKKGQVAVWTVYNFGSYYFSKDSEKNKAVWYFNYDSLGRVSSCEKYIWKMNKEDEIDEFYHYKSVPTHLTYMFKYDASGKASEIVVVDREKGLCTNTHTFGLDYKLY
jgi:hypothetical protein